MKITYPMIDVAIGARITVAIGDMKGTWVHLELDHTGQLNPGLKGELRPLWANIDTGQVRHASWLIGEETS